MQLIQLHYIILLEQKRIGKDKKEKESKETQKERHKQPRKKSKRSWRYGIETTIKMINVAR